MALAFGEGPFSCILTWQKVSHGEIEQAGVSSGLFLLKSPQSYLDKLI
jgi:hypothetical protein